jgi:hypothetical protein
MAIETSNISATSMTGSLLGTASFSNVATYALGTVILNGTEVIEYSDLMQFFASGLPITKYTNPNLKWLSGNNSFGSTQLSAIDVPNLEYLGSAVFSGIGTLSGSLTFPLVTFLNGSTINNTPITSFSLPALINTGSALLINNATAVVSASFDVLPAMNTNAFQTCTALRYIYTPQVKSVTANIFSTTTTTPANSGSIWINSAVTASAQWNTSGNLQRLQSKGWVINYVNG